MATPTTKYLTQSALFMALGVLIPILFHAIGLGSVFLPMFWPVAMSAFFLPIPYALMVGGLTPILSSLLTGMPPISPPILQVMMFELVTLSGVVSALYKRTRLGLVWLLAIGMLASRFVLFIIVYFLAPILGLPKVLSIAAVVRGIPGIVFIISLLPFIVRRFTNDPIIHRRI